MSQHNLLVNQARRKALLRVVENSIDMYSDMALDPMWMTPSTLRELAMKTTTEIQATMSTNSKEASDNIDTLIELHFIRSELLNME